MIISVHLENGRRVAEDRRDCYWLYIGPNCLPAVPGGAQAGAMKPKFQETIKDPARNAWHEVFKVQHYWLEINLIAQPMRVEQAGAT